MNILFFNWRDIRNPQSGGAEVLTHEMAKRWVLWGHSVVQFSSLFPSGVSEELVDGVRIIRRGSADFRSLTIPVHLAAYRWYMRHGRGTFDIVIDEIHGIPFFTPWYVKEKKIALICEVADEIWGKAFSFPANVIGPIVERNYFRWYKQIPFLTISPSTRKDLMRMGVHPSMITLLPMGMNKPKSQTRYRKEKIRTLLFVARLTKAKGIEDALEVCRLVKQHFPQIALWVVGQGTDEYNAQIHTIIRDKDLNQCVRMYGYISESKKYELMGKAHLLIVPSVKEGWGLTVPEAGYVGTPAIGYDVAGLSDVICSGQTGLLTIPHPSAMAEGVIRLLGDRTLYHKVSIGTRKLARTYSWDKTARVGLSLLSKI